MRKTTITKAPLKTKKFEADETEKAQFAFANEHFEVEVRRRNSKFLEVLIIVSLLFILTKTVEARNLWDANKLPKFSIASGTLNINGTKFDQPWKINPFLSAIGGKYVTKNLFHKVYTFDDLGVHIYEYPKKEEANEVQISFVNQKLKFAPKNNFLGSFKIEKVAITRKTNIQKVITSLPTYKFTKGNQGNFYRGEFKGVYVYLNYSDNSFKLLDFISFGTTTRN